MDAEYEYKVVRTYIDNTSHLEKAFENGFEFVTASEFIKGEFVNGDRYKGYVEYILRRRLKMQGIDHGE